jgi:SAM-dependent methyltransferase
MVQQFKDYTRFGWQLLNGFRMQHERWIADLRSSDMAPFLNGNHTPTVLDLANGQLRPQYSILRMQGCRVYGIDRVNQAKPALQNNAYKIARWLYTRNLRSKDSCADDALICGDVSMLPFRGKSFDVVTSVAAFEHFLEVEMVLDEVDRVMRPGGLVWVLVHLFSSPSGGHNVSLSEIPLRTLPRGVDPWDHLRQRRLSFHVPLNQWRKHEYLREFEKRFEVLKQYCAMREGEHLLTPIIESELSEFTRDELTCGAYVIVARKPA